jgi:hypothetical protein
MSRLNDILERISEIQEGIAVNIGGDVQQITRAYPYLEWSVPSAVCPFFANHIGDFTFAIAATGGTVQIEQPIMMHLCLQPVESGISLASNLSYSYEWIDAIMAALVSKIRLGGDLPYIVDAWPKSGGIERVSLGDVEYLALRIDYTVRQRFSVPLAE